MVYFWLVLGGSLLTAGDIAFKFWVLKPSPALYAGGMLLYVLGAACLIETYKTQNIAVATALFIIVNLVPSPWSAHSTSAKS